MAESNDDEKFFKSIFGNEKLKSDHSSGPSKDV